MTDGAHGEKGHDAEASLGSERGPSGCTFTEDNAPEIRAGENQIKYLKMEASSLFLTKKKETKPGGEKQQN